LLENTFDQKRIFANPSPSPNPNSNPIPKAQYCFWTDEKEVIFRKSLLVPQILLTAVF